MAYDNRITDEQPWDAALVMGILYTIIYAGMISALMLVQIPEDNAKAIDILAGAMTAIQIQIVGFFFGSSKNAEKSQRLIAQSTERTNSTMRDIVSSVAPTAPLKVDDMNVSATGNVTVNETKP